MKVPDSGHEERMLACGESWTLDGQAGMSKKRDNSDYSYYICRQNKKTLYPSGYKVFLRALEDSNSRPFGP